MTLDSMTTRDLLALRNAIDSLLPQKRREAIAELRAEMSRIARDNGLTLDAVLKTRTRPASRAKG